ncbi:MAG TPA: amylo-alpha-1,6-glucosidase [Bryobacteraceae bacterium]|nr:amylo-alpha-1,6-glucosidase [Bryobacteraceae bacterium]
MNKIFSRNTALPFGEEELRLAVETEWLVTNGLGGYASCSIAGTLTRVFHGYLIAALAAPLGRTMMLNEILEEVVFPDGRRVALNGLLRQEEDARDSARHLASFHTEGGLPVWTYEFEGITLEKKLVLPHHQNTVYVNYRLTYGAEPVKLQLRPAVNMREHEAAVNSPIEGYTVTIRDHRYELKADNDLPPLRLSVLGEAASFSMDILRIPDVVYEIERSRGYIWHGDLWSPGYFSIDIDVAKEATLVASTEPWNVMLTLDPKQAWDAEQDRKRRLLLEASSKAGGDMCHQLVWAADQFLFTPVGRPVDTTRASAAGDEIRSVIAGYHWFTDWGRDTMISLEGLTLATGRRVEASYILRTFAHYIRDGLVPNMFPEGRSEGLYHTADATLWFFHACRSYLQQADDPHLLAYLLPQLIDIVAHHLRGTKFNIHVDHEDGLLVQGQEGYQLTWMDAKVDGWVVTPRRGKAVEINALWYNALRLLEGWLREADRQGEADGIATHAERARESFNKRFWNEERGYLYDLIDGENSPADPCCRPNQIFAISLEHPILHRSKWEPVVQTVKERLLTPVGLRSLAPGEPDYKTQYDGDLRSRDAAYHQGTVWAWLMGPFIDAWLRVYPGDQKTARGFLSGFETHLQSACVGSISEIFDAEAPFLPRGCCAQAWSVAEVLRCFVKTNAADGK